MNFAYKISSWNRKRKFRHFIKTISPKKEDKLLDVGFSNSASYDEVNSIEIHYPYPENITALGLETEGTDFFKSTFPLVKVVLYDGNKFPFDDNTFDIGWSNAVIEHVGDKSKQINFLKELVRTCKTVYFTTPNKYFPIELHTMFLFIHWFPNDIFHKILSKTKKARAEGNNLYLLSKRQIKIICKAADAEIISIKRNRFFGFTMNFCVIVKKH